MDPSSERWVGRNESLLRDVNEAIEQGRWPDERDHPVRFRCECARLDCNEVVQLTVREYEQIREHPRRFAVAAGHELPEYETVVDTRPGYVLVEKRAAAGEAAEELDPRS